MTRRFGYVAAVVALSVVPLTGCDQAADKLSSADACADLIGLSLRELRDAQEHVNSPEKVARSLRQAARKFEAKAEQVDDADVKRAIDDYVAKMKKLGRQVRAGNTPDLDAVIDANSDLADACA